MHPRVTLLLCVLLAAAPGTLRADEVDLAAGDRLIGEIQSVDENIVVIRTPYAEAIELPRADVVGLRTDDVVTVAFDVGSYLTGRLVAAAPSALSLEHERTGAITPFPLSDVKGVYRGDPMEIAAARERSATNGNPRMTQTEVSSYEDPVPACKAYKVRCLRSGSWRNFVDDAIQLEEAERFREVTVHGQAGAFPAQIVHGIAGHENHYQLGQHFVELARDAHAVPIAFQHPVADQDLRRKALADLERAPAARSRRHLETAVAEKIRHGDPRILLVLDDQNPRRHQRPRLARMHLMHL